MSEIDHEPPSFQRPLLFAEQGLLDARLQQLAIMTASMMGAENCSIMLAEQGSDAVSHLSVWACAGALPLAAWKVSAAAGNGVAGHVFATGESLMIDDIRRSPFADCARQLADQHPSLLCVPIRVNAATVGVVNVSGRPQKAHAADDKLLFALFNVAAACIHVAALQGLKHLLHRQLVGLKLGDIGHHLILLDVAATADNVGHAGYQFQITLHHPILNAAQFHRVEFAVGAGVQKTWEVLSTTLYYLGRLVQGQVPADQLGGFIGIAKASDAVAKMGAEGAPNPAMGVFGAFVALLQLSAILSVSVGFLNLLPIPVLDGGHLVFYAYEAVARRPLAANVQAVGYRLGLALLLGFMLFAVWNDLQRYNVFNFLGGLFS